LCLETLSIFRVRIFLYNNPNKISKGVKIIKKLSIFLPSSKKDAVIS